MFKRLPEAAGTPVRLTVDGKAIKFPDDYKGKVVLLDFWGNW